MSGQEGSRSGVHLLVLLNPRVAPRVAPLLMVTHPCRVGETSFNMLPVLCRSL